MAIGTSSIRSARWPEDPRVGEPPVGESGQAMGWPSTPQSYSELYTALEQGVLDGGENAAGNVLNDRFYEVTGYLSLTQHFRPPGIVAISMQTWKRLNEKQQQALTEEAVRLQDYEIALTAEVTNKAIEELKAKGMKINDANVDAFRAKMAPVYESFKAKHGKELLEAVQNTKP